MKPIYFTIAIVVSLAVSVALMVAMPNITNTESSEQIEQQPQAKKLYTIADLSANPNLYTYDEALSMITTQYIKFNQDCDGYYENDLTLLTDCYTKVNYWRAEVDDILEREYQ